MDLYDDEDGSVQNKPTAQAEPEKKGDGDSDQPTAIIPKSLLAGKTFEVGDSVVLKIKAMHEDDVEVAYDTSGTKDEQSGGSKSSMPESSAGSDYD
jgi:hypothetical protein